MAPIIFITLNPCGEQRAFGSTPAFSHRQVHEAEIEPNNFICDGAIIPDRKSVWIPEILSLLSSLASNCSYYFPAFKELQ
jgi:hypothetical protein